MKKVLTGKAKEEKVKEKFVIFLQMEIVFLFVFFSCVDMIMNRKLTYWKKFKNFWAIREDPM